MMDEEMCKNCVTPWKCNGPHRPGGKLRRFWRWLAVPRIGSVSGSGCSHLTGVLLIVGLIWLLVSINSCLEEATRELQRQKAG